MKKHLAKLTLLLGLVFVFLASTAPRFFAEDESKQYTFYNTASDVAQVMEEFTATGKDTMSKVAKVTTKGVLLLHLLKLRKQTRLSLMTS